MPLTVQERIESRFGSLKGYVCTSGEADERFREAFATKDLSTFHEIGSSRKSKFFGHIIGTEIE